jgi:acetyl esterase/lipase
VTLHPQFRAYLDGLEQVAVAQDPPGALGPAEARAGLASLNTYSLPKVPIARVRDASVASMLQQPAVPVRVYVPRPGVECDVVCFVHGGGHMAGDLDVYDFSARRLAGASGMIVVSVDYRRSPETPFPGGLHDAHHALTHLDEVLVGEATTGQVHAFADSGGAAKVASIAMRVAGGQWRSPIRRQVLVYPSLDYTLSGASVQELGEGYFLTAERVRWYFDHYFLEGTDRAAASPLWGAVSADMPDTLVIAAEYDPLRSEAEAYVARMRRAGASAHLMVAPGMIHAFAFFESLVPEACARLYEVATEFLATGRAPTHW